MASSIIDLTTFDAALRLHFTGDAIKTQVYKNHPLLAVLAKMESFGGRDDLEIPIIYGTPRGRSASLAAAKEGKHASEMDNFHLTRAANYSYIELDSLTLAAADVKNDSWMTARQFEIDAMLMSVSRDVSSDLFRNGFGVRGRILTIDAGAANLITLETPSDIVNFERGDRIILTATDATPGAGALRDSGADVEIATIDRDAGSFTYTGTDIALAAATDYIHIRGDRGSAATRRKLVGLDGWLPATAPTAGDSFFGVDRSVDATRLAGHRVTGTASTVMEALIDAGARLFREGGKPDLVVMNPVHAAELAKELMSHAVYEPVKSENGVVSFDGLVVRTPGGKVRVLEDPSCPAGVAYMLQSDVWKMYSLGPVPHLVDEDGKISQRLQPSAYTTSLAVRDGDGVEIRGRAFSNLGCRAPGWNARISLAT